MIAGIIEHIGSITTLSPNAEITMEANPTSVEASKFEAIASAGVNRLSLGIQSLNPEQLRFLGRTHSVDEAREAIDLAAKNFKRYSFDLIYALPNQTEEEWAQELQGALRLAGGHLSLYQLTIEKGTEFFKLHRDGEFTMPDPDLAASMYQLTDKIMYSNGYISYEVSNYANPGHECVHNLQYWRYKDYLGVGPGAHSRVTKNRVKYSIQKISSPETWMNKVMAEGHGTQQREEISGESQLVEELLMGLRTNEGIHVAILPDLHKAHMLVENGFLRIDGERVICTKEGRLVLNSIIRELVL